MPPKLQKAWPSPVKELGPEEADQLEPVPQFEKTQRQLNQDTADWKAEKTRKVWKQDRREAHVESKRVMSEEDRNTIVIN